MVICTHDVLCLRQTRSDSQMWLPWNIVINAVESSPKVKLDSLIIVKTAKLSVTVPCPLAHPTPFVSRGKYCSDKEGRGAGACAMSPISRANLSNGRAILSPD